MVLQEENNHAIDDLLVKYLLHETTDRELTEAEQWINASSDHQRYFVHFKQIWQSSRQLQPFNSPDEEEAWQRFQQRLKNKNTFSPHRINVIKRRRLLAAAAVLLLIIAGGWLYNQLNTSAKMVTLASGENIRTDTLSDGTIITLNKNSLISYPAQFSGKPRTVALAGEAFFDVAQQKNHPFIVHVNQVTITVLGTSFNVNSTGGATAIIVESGKIKVTERKKSIELSAHEKVTISGKKGIMEKKTVNNELYNYYRTKEFNCNKTPLRELISILNKSYNTHIIIANSTLGDLRLTTTFYHRQPLDSILSIISQTFSQVTFSKQGKQIILK